MPNQPNFEYDPQKFEQTVEQVFAEIPDIGLLEESMELGDEGRLVGLTSSEQDAFDSIEFGLQQDELDTSLKTTIFVSGGVAACSAIIAQFNGMPARGEAFTEVFPLAAYSSSILFCASALPYGLRKAIEKYYN